MATPYADLCASLGAVSYFPLQADAVDTIGAHNLTLAGSPSFGAAGPGGELASALTLVAASDQWGSVNHAALRPTTALSVVGWAKVNSNAQANHLWGCGTTGFMGYRCYMNSGSNVYAAQIKDGVSVAVATVGVTAIGTAWAMVGHTYDKTDQRIYVNGGHEGGEDAATFDIGYGGEAFYIGNYDGNATRDFDGLVAGVAVFPTALSAANMAALYAAVMFGGQIVLPDADVTTTGWSATPLWSKVDDDPSAPDGTVITATSA